MEDSLKITAVYKSPKRTLTLVTQLVKKLINTSSLELRNHIIKDLFVPFPGVGTRYSIPDKLATHSGNLKRSVHAITAKVEGDMVVGGITYGTAYGRVHINKKGTETTIKPKHSQFLTIPLPAAQKASGLARGRAIDKAVWGDTFFGKSKAGNIILFGKLKYLKGQRAGETRGSIVPLFILKKEVKVKARITIEDLIKWIEPIIGKGLRSIKDEVSRLSIDDALQATGGMTE
jgi:hypothetical protein